MGQDWNRIGNQKVRLGGNKVKYADEVTSTVTISGILDERPTFGETGTGEPRASFWVRNGDNAVECVAVGPMVKNLQVFGMADVSVVVSGHLDWFVGDPDLPHVKVRTLGFTTPIELRDLMGLDN